MGKLPKPTRVLDQTYTVEPAQDGERFVTLRRVGQGQNLIVAYHAVAAGHPDAAALQLLSGVMNGGGGGRGGRGGGRADGRLAKALVETKLAQSANMRFQQLHDPGHERHVGAREDREAHRVGVLLDHCLGDLLRRLVEAGVDHLHACVPKRTGDDLRAAIVSVEARLGHDDADLAP